jgi:hypothetical protein
MCRYRNQTGFEKYINLIKGITRTYFMLIKYFEIQNLHLYIIYLTAMFSLIFSVRLSEA